jgi:hypothetical protein
VAMVTNISEAGQQPKKRRMNDKQNKEQRE